MTQKKAAAGAKSDGDEDKDKDEEEEEEEEEDEDYSVAAGRIQKLWGAKRSTSFSSATPSPFGEWWPRR
jgi:hypothetical protein